jgi:hypothetical protein
MLHYVLPFQLLPNNPTRYVRHTMALGFGRGRDGFHSRCGRLRGRGLGRGCRRDARWYGGCGSYHWPLNNILLCLAEVG